MGSIDFENLINPMGSVHHSQSRKKDSVADRDGYYSANNPAIGLIEDFMASGKYNDDDIGDLYDKASQWEIDQATWLNQLKVDQAIKEEQREYDSPLQQVARERAAGINRDVLANSGGSGGGSGATAGTSAGASIDNNTGGVGNTDNYAGRLYTLQAIQTAGQFISDMANSANTLINGIGQLEMIQPQMNMYNAQAGLMDAQSNEINSLLAGKEFDQNMSQIKTLQGMLHNGFTDEQGISLLNTFGIGEQNHQGYMDAIRMIHERPEVLAQWEENQIQKRKSKARGVVYTSEYLSNLVKTNAETEMSQSTTKLYQSQIDEALNRLLMEDDDYVNNQADSILTSAKMNKENAQQAYKELQEYAKLWADRQTENEKQIGRIDQEIDRMEKLKKSRGNAGNPEGWLTEHEEAYYDGLLHERLVTKYAGANNMMMFLNSMNNFGKKKYLQQCMVGQTGLLFTLNGRQKIAQFTDGMFSHYIQGTKSGAEIVSECVKAVGMGIGIMSGGLNSGLTGGLTTRSLYNSQTQQWVPQERWINVQDR